MPLFAIENPLRSRERPLFLPAAPFALTTLLGVLVAASAHAQDPFEIHVYDYETLKPGQFTLEQHLNYWGIGSKRFDGTLAPTNDQFHMTYELTGGLTNHFSLGFMQLSAVLPGAGLEYAGWRVLPHFYAPESWRLPVQLGLVGRTFIRAPAIHRRYSPCGTAADPQAPDQGFRTGL